MRSDNRPPPLRAVAGSSVPLMADALVAVTTQAGFATTRYVDAAAARLAVLDASPTVAILDFADAVPTGLDTLRDARAAGCETRIILFCASVDGIDPLEAVELGVDGLLLRDAASSVVAECVAAVADGQQWLDPRAMKVAYDRLSQRHATPPALLTRRERDVARLVATGQRNRGIAETLGISEGTVKMHLHNVYAKMGLESRTQLAMDARLQAMG